MSKPEPSDAEKLALSWGREDAVYSSDFYFSPKDMTYISDSLIIINGEIVYPKEEM